MTAPATTTLSTIPSTPSAPQEAADAPAKESEQIADNAATPEIPTQSDPAPKEDGPDPDLVIAQKLDAVSRQQARARKLEQSWHQKLAAVEEKEKALEAKMAELDAALDDPVAHYINKGKDPVEVAKRFAKPVTEEEKRIRKLEERLAKDEEEREKQRKQWESRQQAQQRNATLQKFVNETDPKEYPYMTSVYKPGKVGAAISELLNSPQDPTDGDSPSVLEAFRSQYGRSPTDKEIRDALEHQAELHAMNLIERIPKKESAASQVTPTTPPANEESTSLSNQHAASSSSGSSRNKSREERMKELKDELAAEMAAQDQ